MKKLLAVLLIMAMLLPGLVLAEAEFAFLYLDCNPILSDEGSDIPFVILTNRDVDARWMNRESYAAEIGKKTSIRFWSKEKQRYGQVFEPMVEGVDQQELNGVTVNRYDTSSLSGTLSFNALGEMRCFLMSQACEQYVVPGDEYEQYAGAVLERVVAEYSYDAKGNRLSDTKIARQLHDWLCKQLTYSDLSNLDFYDMAYQATGYAGLYMSKGKCTTYAGAYQMLLRAAGIHAFTVSGTNKKGELHAWNIARLDGQWVYVDATWDDKKKGFKHDYFAVSKKKMDRDHILDEESEAFVRYLTDGRFEEALRKAGWQ